MKRASRKKIFALLTLVAVLSLQLQVFAAEPDSVVTDEVNSDVVGPETPEVTPRTITGYAAGYTSLSSGSFTIEVTGSASLVGTAKMKAWSFSHDSVVYVTLYRPDGSCAFSDCELTLETEKSKIFTGFGPGTYKLCYDVIGSGRGWIYCNLSA